MSRTSSTVTRQALIVLFLAIAVTTLVHVMARIALNTLIYEARSFAYSGREHNLLSWQPIDKGDALVAHLLGIIGACVALSIVVLLFKVVEGPSKYIDPCEDNRACPCPRHRQEERDAAAAAAASAAVTSTTINSV
ncbi:MAG TPA: hypothetical protein VF597_02495 [Candidatus Saccharimonadales bacterium]